MKESEEERNNKLVYESIIRDPQELIELLSTNMNYQLNCSKYLPMIKKERKEIYNDLNNWFKDPYNMNCACNILRTIDKLYDIPEEEKTGLLSYIFDNYEHQAFMNLNYNPKPNPTKLELRKELKARKYKKLDKVSLKDEGYYLFHRGLAMILPKQFLTREELPQAQFLYGLQTEAIEARDLLAFTS